MPGKSTQQQQQTQTQAQNQQQNPWAPTVPLLGNIIKQLGAQNTSVTQGQSGALADLTGAASDIQSFLPQATGVANDLVGATPTYSGMLSDAYSGLQKSSAPFLSESYLDPYSNPYLSGALQTVRGDVTKSINDQFAAAGRDLSPANTTALARGITQAEAPILMGQYNTNVGTQLGAAGNLFNAGAGTAAGLTGLDQTAIGNRLQGLNIGGMLSDYALAPGQAKLNVANTAYAQPFQNIGMLNQQLMPIAALGGQQTGNSTTNTTGSTTAVSDPMSNIVGGVTGGLGLLGSTGAFGSAGYLAPMLAMLSDERAKENIEPVGELFDGQPIYSYNYKGDYVPRIGLLAQDVEQVAPEAVVDVGGMKAVDYGKATERSRHLGMLSLAA